MTLSEGQGHRTNRLYRPLVGLSSQQTWSTLLENSEIIASVWPWMKVKVNIIHTWCIMSEAVTVSNLMMTFIVSEESLARDMHTQRLGLGYLPCFANKNQIWSYLHNTLKSERNTEAGFPPKTLAAGDFYLGYNLDHPVSSDAASSGEKLLSFGVPYW